MIVPDGYSDVPAGRVATVVTSLQMTAHPGRRPEAGGGTWSLRAVERPDLDWYRDLYRRVGEDWLWFSRLRMSDGELAGIVHDSRVAVYAFEAAGAAEGLLELDFRAAGECELAFFGLTAAVQGTGAGRWLMNRALDLVWQRPVERLWVHTCTLDHPGALAFYVRSGFVPFRRQIEVAEDPRLTGTVPRTAAPHVPIIG
ncbi:N-acetyltransferase [Thalassobaculum fulvum]|uniref:N-acetyltransferase n=1 Tax=Thalassobaculum fulvum TaxID=1633335 RepID=A0A919CQD7_9PROT|nr:GNAT family N-acetyltransferase [Thalassobaculum fulvum]GHD54513.1 N-acetyltransferase [Thalassobaculum fulvum]